MFGGATAAVQIMADIYISMSAVYMSAANYASYRIRRMRLTWNVQHDCDAGRYLVRLTERSELTERHKDDSMRLMACELSANEHME